MISLCSFCAMHATRILRDAHHRALAGNEDGDINCHNVLACSFTRSRGSALTPCRPGACWVSMPGTLAQSSIMEPCGMPTYLVLVSDLRTIRLQAGTRSIIWGDLGVPLAITQAPVLQLYFQTPQAN